MIAKITYGNSIFSMIEYNEKKVEEGLATRILANGFVTERKMEFIGRFLDMVKETKMEEFTFHCSLNLPIGEDVSDEKFVAIAKDYMAGLQMGEQPFIVYRHKDTEHKHIHIVSVLIDDNGKRIDRFYQYTRSEELCADLEKKYDLTLVNHSGNREDNELVVRENLIFNRKGTRSEVARISRYIKDNYNVTNLSELKKVYAHHGVALKAVDLTPHGKTGEFGLVYVHAASTDNPIKSSEIYHDVTWSGWERNFARNKSKREKVKPPAKLKTTIQDVLTTHKSITYDDFKYIMYGENILVLYDSNASGHYGVTFVDKDSGVFYKGSELNFSFSTLQQNGVGANETITNKVVSLQDFIAKQLYYDLYRQHYEDAGGRQSVFIQKHLTAERLVNSVLDHKDYSNVFITLADSDRSEIMLWIDQFIQKKYDKIASLEQVERGDDSLLDKQKNIQSERTGAPGTKEDRQFLGDALRSLVKDFKPVWRRRSHIIEYLLSPELLLPYVRQIPEFGSKDEAELIVLTSQYVNYQRGRLVEIKADEALNRLFSLQYRPYMEELILNSKGSVQALMNISVDEIISNISKSTEFANLQNNAIFGDHITGERLNSLAKFIVERDFENIRENFYKLYVKNRLENYVKEQKQHPDNHSLPHDKFLTYILKDNLVHRFFSDNNLNGGSIINEDNRNAVKLAIDDYYKELSLTRNEALLDRIIRDSYKDLINTKDKDVSESGFIAGSLNNVTLFEYVKEHVDFPEFLTFEVAESQEALAERRVNEFIRYKKQMIHFVYASEGLASFKTQFYASHKADNISRERACTELLKSDNVKTYLHDLVNTQKPQFIADIPESDLSEVFAGEADRFVQKELLNAPYYALMQLASEEIGRSYQELRALPEYSTIGEARFITESLTTELLLNAVTTRDSYQNAYSAILQKYDHASTDFLKSILNNSIQSFIDYKNDALDTIVISESFNQLLVDHKTFLRTRSQVIEHALTPELLFSYAAKHPMLRLDEDSLRQSCLDFVSNKKNNLSSIRADEAMMRLINTTYRPIVTELITNSEGSYDHVLNALSVEAIKESILTDATFSVLQENAEFGSFVNKEQLQKLLSFVCNQDIAQMKSDYVSVFTKAVLEQSLSDYKLDQRGDGKSEDVIMREFLSQDIYTRLLSGSEAREFIENNIEQINHIIRDFRLEKEILIRRLEADRIIKESYVSILSSLPQDPHRESKFLLSADCASKLNSAINDHLIGTTVADHTDIGMSNRMRSFLLQKESAIPEIYLKEALVGFRSSFYAAMDNHGIKKEQASTGLLTVNDAANYLHTYLKENTTSALSSTVKIDTIVNQVCTEFVVKEIEKAPYYAAQDLYSSTVRESYKYLRSISDNTRESSLIQGLTSNTLKHVILSDEQFRKAFRNIISSYPNVNSKILLSMLENKIENYVSYKQKQLQTIIAKENQYSLSQKSTDAIDIIDSGIEGVTGALSAQSGGKKPPKKRKKKKLD